MSSKSYLYSIIYTFFTIQLTIALLYLYSKVDYQVASCMPNRCFCEAVNHKSIIKQFSNTLSSFTFVYLGFFIYLNEKKDIFFKLLALFTIAIGLGSAFFHASLSFLGQSFDIGGIYLLATFITFYALYRYFHLSVGEFIILLIVVNTVLDLGLILAPELRRYIVALMLFIGVISEYSYIRKMRSSIDTIYLKRAIFLLLFAFFLWGLDITKIVCYPQSIFQAHAIWHILTTLAVYYLYKYYKMN